MNNIIRNIAIEKAWQSLEVQARTGGGNTTKFEMDDNEYTLVGGVSASTGAFLRADSVHLRGVGNRIPKNAFIPVPF